MLNFYVIKRASLLDRNYLRVWLGLLVHFRATHNVMDTSSTHIWMLREAICVFTLSLKSDEIRVCGISLLVHLSFSEKNSASVLLAALYCTCVFTIIGPMDLRFQSGRQIIKVGETLVGSP